MPAGLSRARLSLVCLTAWLLTGICGAGAAASDQASPQVAGSSGEISLLLKDGAFHLGDVSVRMASDSSVSVERTSFINGVRRILRPEALAAFEKALSSAAYVPLAQIEAAGLPCTFDSENLEIQVSPKVEQRPRGEISGSMRSEGATPQDLAKGALVSGFVNMHFGASYDRNNGEDVGQVALPVTLLDGAVRIADLVVEGEVDTSWDGQIVRRGTRAVYDLPQDAVRVTAGDLAPATGGSQLSPPLLGVRVEKSYEKLQPTRNVHPTGRRSFRVERPSEIDVLLNGHPIRHLKVVPGEYDLDDLPLGAGANNIQLHIKDDTGREETLDFSVLFDRSLLNVGVSEWSATAGFTSNFDHGLIYDYSEPYANAAYRLGLLENLTGEASFQAGNQTAAGGVSALTQTPIGFLAFDGLTSANGDRGVGWFGSASLQMAMDKDAAAGSALHLGVELESKSFMQPGAELSTKDPWLRLDASYSRSLGETVTGVLSGRYSFADKGEDDRFGVGLSLSKSFNEGLVVSVSGSYTSQSSGIAANDLTSGFSILGRLNYRLDTSSSLSVGLDPLNQRVTAKAGTSVGNGVGSWSTAVELTAEPGHDNDQADKSVDASLSYIGNRFELDTSHSADLNTPDDIRHVHHAVSVDTAIAFADTEVAVGRPIRSGFALVDTHPSLKDSELHLAPSPDGDAAISDWLGPAVLPDVSAYSPTRIAYDLDDVPEGYDTGNGAIDVLAPYRAGYHVTVGSGATVTVVGNLQDREGHPEKLLSGFAYPKQHPDHKLQIFTNSDGRFGAPGFAPGDWIVELGEPGPLQYQFSLPSDAAGIRDVGVLDPSQ